MFQRREVEDRLLGVKTNITNWQRKQNQNNNFSAVIPCDLEQQRKESKEFLDDLATCDQRMMFAVLKFQQMDGQNVISKNMIIANRRHLLNGNSFILGVSGAGQGREKLFTPEKLFCCEFAPYFMEGIKVRYPEYCRDLLTPKKQTEHTR